MERIQAAIQKAKEQRGDVDPIAPRSGPGAVPRGARLKPPAAATALWADLPLFEPDSGLMTRNRIVTFADADPSHVAFDMMRTKILRTMRQNGWTSLGVTSPTAGSGKSTTCINLAFSLAHQPDVRTVLVDLDLRRPALAKLLGLTRAQSFASVLRGDRPLAETFVRYGENLAIGTNDGPVRASSELLLNAATAHNVAAFKAGFAADVLLYDMPPMLQSDDVMAFLPHLDCVLLIAAAEKSRLDEVDKCERELSEQTNVLGVVLNMCRYTGEDYGYQ